MNRFIRMRNRLAAGIAILLSLCLLAGLYTPARAEAARKGDVYIVEKGDCLYSIGRALETDWKEIAELNGIKSPYTIYIGQELKLSAEEEEEQTDEEKTDEEKKDAQEDDAEEKDAQKDEDGKDSPDKDDADAEDDKDAEDDETADTGNFDEWVVSDLLEGDCYGIYPLTWYEDDMRKPLSEEQLEVLMKGIGDKLLKIEGTAERYTAELTYSEGMTVEDFLNNLFVKLQSYEYTKSLGLEKRYSMTAYMMEYGIYTGEKGEPALEDVCSVQDACVYGSRVIKMAYNALGAASKGFLWETSYERNTVYLLGSIHLASNDIYPFSEELYDRYEQSDALVEEVNLYDQDGFNKFSMQALYMDGTTLRDYVSEEVYNQAIELASLLGLTEEVASLCKPWYLANAFTVLATTDSSDLTQTQTAAALGIDMHFLSKAYLEERPVLEAEGYEKQAAVMDSFSPELDEYLLTTAIEQLKAVIAGETEDAGEDATDLEDWLEMWRKGDSEGFIDSFGDSLNEENHAAFEGADAETAALEAEYLNKMVTQRDKGMAEFVDGLLKDGTGKTYFVIVGAGHYASESSVLKQLEEMGYQISAVK